MNILHLTHTDINSDSRILKEMNSIADNFINTNVKGIGVKIDEEKNNCRGEEVEISANDSNVKVYVIPTNEELMIARDTRDIVLNTK